MSALPFARLVSDAMARRGLGLRELCRQAKLDPSFLSKVLAGKRNPPAEEDVLRRMATVLETNAVELFVAAGRIPSEWSNLNSNPELLRRVHLMASSRSAVPRVPHPLPLKSVAVNAVPPSYVKKPFNEELL